MEGRLLIRGCAIWRDGSVAEGLSVVVEGETISAIEPEQALKALPGDWVCEARGRFLTPGLFLGAGATTTAAGERFHVANALRHGVTAVAFTGDAAIAEQAAEIGARVLLGEGPLRRGRHDEESLFLAPGKWLTERLGLPFGRVAVGAPADLVLWDWVPSARSSRFAMLELEVLIAAWVIVGGRVAVREGQLVGHDFIALAAAAR